METNPQQAKLIRQYLLSAPDEISDWAQEQLAVLNDGQPLPDGDVADPEPSQEAYDPALALAELGEDDEGELPPPRPTPAKKSTPTVDVHTPSDKPERPDNTTVMPRTAKIVLAAVAAIAVIVGVYQLGVHSGQPDVTAKQETTTGMPDNTLQDEQANQMSDVQKEERIAQLEKVLDNDPDDIQAHLELGVLVFDEADPSQAQYHWEKITQIDPTVAQAWYNLGFLYQTLDPPQPDKAQEAWGKVVELEPDSDMAQIVTMHGDMIDRTRHGEPPTLKKPDGDK